MRQQKAPTLHWQPQPEMPRMPECQLINASQSMPASRYCAYCAPFRLWKAFYLPLQTLASPVDKGEATQTRLSLARGDSMIR